MNFSIDYTPFVKMIFKTDKTFEYEGDINFHISTINSIFTEENIRDNIQLMFSDKENIDTTIKNIFIEKNISTYLKEIETRIKMAKLNALKHLWSKIFENELIDSELFSRLSSLLGPVPSMNRQIHLYMLILTYINEYINIKKIDKDFKINIKNNYTNAQVLFKLIFVENNSKKLFDLINNNDWNITNDYITHDNLLQLKAFVVNAFDTLNDDSKVIDAIRIYIETFNEMNKEFKQELYL